MDYREILKKRIGVEKFEDYKEFPKFFTIETCNNCNARCIMCPKARKETKSLEIMSDDLFSRLTCELAEYRNWIEMICLNSDGEPLLDPFIAKRVFELKKIGIRHVNISTNASLLTKKMIRELIESGLDDIRISLDGYTKQVYEKIRRGLIFENVMENVHQLIHMRDRLKSKMSIRIRMVELDENLDEREDWMAYWREKCNLQIDKVQIMPKHTWSGLVENNQEETIEYYADKPCISVFSSFTVNFDGIVQLCDSDVEQKEVVGDIRKQSVKAIWQGEMFENIRNYHIRGQRNNIEICQGCDHWMRTFRED